MENDFVIVLNSNGNYHYDNDGDVLMQRTADQILHLIHLYKENRASFASTTTKNIKVWQKIANHLETHSATQCENKFKYLKSKYLQKKDNMSQTSSGARIIKFDFFKEMDDIFHKEPIVKPLSIASSSRDNIEQNIDPASSATAKNQVLEAVTQTAQEPDSGNLTGSQGTGTRRNIKLKEALNEL